MTAEQPKRGRTTLIEALVVIILIVLLVAVLLPSVAELNINWHRTQCFNNMKQLALAVHTYHSTRKGKLPPGTIVGSAKGPEERLSLLVLLMPYMEAETHFKKLDLTQGWRAEKNGPVVAIPMPYYQCPSHPRERGDEPTFTTYVACAGVGEDAASLPVKHPRAGMFGYDREMNIATSFPDGASQTLMFLETTRDNGPWAAGGPPTLRGVDPDDPRPVRDGGAFGLVHNRSRLPWKSNPAGSNVALADGSVRGMDGQISPEVLAALATVAGGEDLSAGW